MRSHNEDAVSEVVSLILTLMIVTGTITTVLVWGVPYMDDRKAFVAVESVLLQFDSLNDLMDDTFGEGTFEAEYGPIDDPIVELANSSKTMNFKLDTGDLYVDTQGERFVFFYSTSNGVSFSVSGFDPDYPLYNAYQFKFSFDIAPPRVLPPPPNNFELRFYFTQLNTGEIDDAGESFDDGNWWTSRAITLSKFPLNDAVRIDIMDDEFTVYGHIYIFDVGSLMYRISSSVNSYKATVENGGVLSSGNAISRYFFNEPGYFPQKLLDNSRMLTLRIIQIKNNPNEGISSIGLDDSSTRIKFWLKSYSSSTEESKTTIFGTFNLSVYGDGATVSAWKFFYKYRLNFEYDPIDENNLFWGPKGPKTKTEDVALFSFNHDVCYLKMEVEG